MRFQRSTDAESQLPDRRAKDFLVVEYSTPVSNAAAYYPETHSAAKSKTPVSAIVIQVESAS